MRKPPSGLIKATNPVMRELAGRRWFPAWAQLRHSGRRTGRQYVIPVAVLVTADTFVIGLPWGTETNWVQNVLAAKGCTITWKGRVYDATDPQLVDRAVALGAANGFQRVIISRVEFPGFLQLTRSERSRGAASPPE